MQLSAVETAVLVYAGVWLTLWCFAFYWLVLRR
jgi:hypothetical protein